MGDWLTADEIGQYLDDKDVDGQKLLDRYFPIAVAKFNELTCNALVPQQTGPVKAKVAGDGVTVALPAWFSEVTNVSTKDGTSLTDGLWSFAPKVQEMASKGPTGKAYGKTVDLETEFNTGYVLIVNGTYGFDTLPATIKNALIVMMNSYRSRESGEDYIASKSIEDVNVSSRDISGKDPMTMAMETQQPTIDLWSLCTDKYRIGELSFPRKNYRAPYFIGSEERKMVEELGENAIRMEEPTEQE